MAHTSPHPGPAPLERPPAIPSELSHRPDTDIHKHLVAMYRHLGNQGTQDHQGEDSSSHPSPFPPPQHSLSSLAPPQNAQHGANGMKGTSLPLNAPSPSPAPPSSLQRPSPSPANIPGTPGQAHTAGAATQAHSGPSPVAQQLPPAPTPQASVPSPSPSLAMPSPAPPNPGMASFGANLSAPILSSYGLYKPVTQPLSRFLTPSPEPDIIASLNAFVNDLDSEVERREADVQKLEEEDEFILQNGFGEYGSLVNLGQFTQLTPTTSAAGIKSYIIPSEVECRPKGINPSGLNGLNPSEARRRAQLVHQLAEQSTSEGSARATGAYTDPSASSNSDSPSKLVKMNSLQDLNHFGSSSYPQMYSGSPDCFSLAPGPDSPTDAPRTKKNRNPPASQRPTARQNTPASHGAQTPATTTQRPPPICSHCESTSTPLWRRGPADELLCNACGLYLKLHGKSRPKTFGKQGTRGRASNSGIAAQMAANGLTPTCHNCAAVTTPMWRKDKDGNLTCNACSLYYKLHKVERPKNLAERRRRKENEKRAREGESSLGEARASEGSGRDTEEASARTNTNAFAFGDASPTPTNSIFNDYSFDDLAYLNEVFQPEFKIGSTVFPYSAGGQFE